MTFNQTTRKHVLALIAGLLFASPALAGVVYEIEVKDHDQSPPKTESIQAAVEGRHLKMGISPRDQGGKGGEMIFRGDRREVIVVDHDDQSYHVMDEEAIRSLAGSVGSVMSTMESAMKEALKNMPPEKRKEIEDAMKKGGGMGGGMGGMMGGAKPAPPEIRKTSERGTRSGYPCVKYEVVRDGRVLRELWVTDWSNLEGGAEAQAAFRDMADFFEEMVEALGGAGYLDGLNGYAENFGNGFPVETRSYDESGGLEDESTLRGSRRQRLDPDAFEPPAGYKRMSMGPQ